MYGLVTNLVHFKPQPGTLIIFPGFLKHEYAVDYIGIEPFRFIHWNIQAVPKENGKRCLKLKMKQIF